MLGTLRSRLVLSHALPLLIIIPLMGIALVYVLETQVLLPSISDGLVAQASIVAQVASEQPDVWQNPVEAQAFVDRFSPRLVARLMLLDPARHLLASSDPADVNQLGQSAGQADWARILAGKADVHVEYSPSLRAEVADAYVPVAGTGGQVVGIVRLTHRLTNLYEWFLRLRYIIAGVLITGLVLGAAVGLVLALNLERPLQEVTRAVYQLASGEQLTPLPEQGAEEIRLLSRAFNVLLERLQTLEQRRSKLLANLVHELGRPLGAIHSAIQALAGGADEDAGLRRELLAGITEEIKILRRLLDDLAQLRDQVTGVLEMTCQHVALGEWLPPMLTSWREAAQGKGLNWEVAIAAEMPTLEIDPDRMAQALGNLLSNAIKYTPPGGSVTVGAGVEGAMTWIRVSDTGPGIAPEELANIFTPFYRGRINRRFPQGMGLGLSIARDLVVAHGGQIEVKSEPGQGSRFTIWLPMPNTSA